MAPLVPYRCSIRKITLLFTPISLRRVYPSMVCCGLLFEPRLYNWTVGILNNTRTTLGRNLLREWLIRPSLSLPIIAARHAAVACFVNPDNITTADDIQGHLSGIRNTPRILRTLRYGRAKVKDWQGIVEVVKEGLAFVRQIDPLHAVCLSCRYDPRFVGRVDTRKPRGYFEEGGI